MANEQNLIPARKGEIRNPKGRTKGSKNLSTIVRELEREDFDWSKMPIKHTEAVVALGSPWKAITYAAVSNALGGDIKAAEWLRKAGYGDKLDVMSGGEKINKYSDLTDEELNQRIQEYLEARK